MAPMMSTYSQDSLPDSIKVPMGNKVAMETVGVGEITYECRDKATSPAVTPGMTEWVFVGPNAVLNARDGKQVGKYILVAHMEKLDQPFVGVSMTVTASVQYTVIERATRKEILKKTIAVPYTAGFGDAFMATERLKLANEGAIRVNIENLIKELFALNVNALALQ